MKHDLEQFYRPREINVNKPIFQNSNYSGHKWNHLNKTYKGKNHLSLYKPLMKILINKKYLSLKYYINYTYLNNEGIYLLYF